MKFFCGILIGVLIAGIAGAAVYYFCFVKENPRLQAQGVRQIEKNWERTKTTGDKAVYTLKTVAPEEEEGNEKQK